jgi:hypothetical protein
VQLLDGQLDELRLLGPFEAIRLQSLDEQPESVAIPEQNLDPVTPVVAEHIGGGSKRVEPQPLFNQQGESVDALAAISPLPGAGRPSAGNRVGTWQGGQQLKNMRQLIGW